MNNLYGPLIGFSLSQPSYPSLPASPSASPPGSDLGACVRLTPSYSESAFDLSRLRAALSSLYYSLVALGKQLTGIDGEPINTVDLFDEEDAAVEAKVGKDWEQAVSARAGASMGVIGAGWRGCPCVV
jgi:hypothetical protein